MTLKSILTYGMKKDSGCSSIVFYGVREKRTDGSPDGILLVNPNNTYKSKNEI